MKKILAVILAALLVGAAAACSAQESGTQAAVSVRGEITSRYENPDGSVSILVEGQKEEDTEYDRASVTVTDKTAVTKDGGESTPDDLQTGVQVEVRMTGPVMESYPVQGSASEIVILTQE